MPQLRELRTATYTNQDISSFRFVGDYTAPFYRTLHASLTAKQLAGGGNYSAYYTMQRVSTTDYFVGPTITVNVPATNNAVIFEFRDIIAEPGNTYRFYIQGLAGDTTTPDTALRIFEEMSHDILDWGVVTAATGTRITASGLSCVHRRHLQRPAHQIRGTQLRLLRNDLHHQVRRHRGHVRLRHHRRRRFQRHHHRLAVLHLPAIQALAPGRPRRRQARTLGRYAGRRQPRPPPGRPDHRGDAILSDTGTDLPATLAIIDARHIRNPHRHRNRSAGIATRRCARRHASRTRHRHDACPPSTPTAGRREHRTGHRNRPYPPTMPP